MNIFTLSETDNVYPLEIKVDENWKQLLVSFTEEDMGIAFDQQTAKEFLPLLQYYAETGKLPDAEE